MEIGSPAATIWWNFWQAYLAQTFDPIWKSKGVTVARAELNDALGPVSRSVDLNQRPGQSERQTP